MGWMLYVEDEDQIRNLYLLVFRKAGFRVLEATSGAQALELFSAHADTVDIMVCDVLLSDISGPKIVVELRRRRPDLKILFTSGIPAEEAGDMLEGLSCEFLHKPYQPSELVEKIQAMLGLK